MAGYLFLQARVESWDRRSPASTSRRRISLRFSERLVAETDLLAAWLRDERFDRSAYVAGFELEAWLLDRNYFPLAANERYLARLSNPLVVPELSKFNVELNGTPQPLAGQALQLLEDELTATWH